VAMATNCTCYVKQNQRFNCRDTFILTEWHHKYYAIMALTDKMQKAEKRSSAWITWLHQQWWSSEGKSNKRSVTSGLQSVTPTDCNNK
jgi:hypothetical protein